MSLGAQAGGMIRAAEFSPDQGSVTISFPLASRSRRAEAGGLTRWHADWAPRQPQIDSALVKVLARAFRWRRLLEHGAYGTIAKLAEAED